MENKLYKKVRDTIETKLPWSATLIQMQMVYGFPKSLTILDAATRLATETGGVAYLCLSLGDADQIGDNFPVKEDFLPPLHELTLYVVHKEILWFEDGEHFRKFVGIGIIQDQSFRIFYVCYRNADAVANQLPYVCFLELHLAA